MLSTSRFQSLGQTFLTRFPHGAHFTDAQMLEWAREQGDGLANDLLHVDPKKQIGSVKRHLNDGGRSNALPEGDRFIIITEDAKLGLFRIDRYADHVATEGRSAFGKSVRGAMSPLNKSVKALNGIKINELDEEQRAEHEATVQELTRLKEPIRQAAETGINLYLSARLEGMGLSSGDAAKFIKKWGPTIRKDMGLIDLIR